MICPTPLSRGFSVRRGPSLEPDSHLPMRHRLDMGIATTMPAAQRSQSITSTVCQPTDNRRQWFSMPGFAEHWSESVESVRSLDDGVVKLQEDERGNPSSVGSEIAQIRDVAQKILQAFEFIFGCWHFKLSRPFTLSGRTYEVCLDCGKQFAYVRADLGQQFWPRRLESLGMRRGGPDENHASI